MNKEEFTQTMNELVKAGLVTFIKTKPVFTDLARTYLGKTPMSTGMVKAAEQGLVVAENWEDKYKNFIVRCQVPMKGMDSTGNTYSMNNFSKDGLKAFMEILNAGYDLEVLCVTITLYYKSNLAYKKAIGNYLISREWVTLYDSVLTKHNEGTLNNFIKNETAAPPSKFFRG